MKGERTILLLAASAGNPLVADGANCTVIMPEAGVTRALETNLVAVFAGVNCAAANDTPGMPLL
jgi:hypothetical protein